MRFWILLFILYLMVLLKLIFFKLNLNFYDISISANETRSFKSLLSASNFIPFFRIYYYISGQEPYLVGALNLLGNIVLFIPLGFSLPYFLKSVKTKKQLLVSVTIFCLCIEILQLLTGTGQFDIDDVLLNVTGAAIGFYLHRRRVFKTNPIKVASVKENAV